VTDIEEKKYVQSVAYVRGSTVDQNDERVAGSTGKLQDGQIVLRKDFRKECGQAATSDYTGFIFTMETPSMSLNSCGLADRP
jgi:hypothetical protein